MDEIKRLTPAQRARCNRLIRRLCANYDGGNCMPLDDGEGCVCVQMISYSLLCKYFRRAVLPADKALYYTALVAHDMASGAWAKPKGGIPDYTCNEGESL